MKKVMETDDIIDAYTELLADLYNLRYSVRCNADDFKRLSALCANTHDTAGVCFYDGKSEVYEQIAISLSALLDKAESGR